MQHLPGGWVGALTPYLGDRSGEFLAAVAMHEQPCLRGIGDFEAVLAEHLEGYDVTTPPAEVHAAVWLTICVEASSIELVRALRDVGVGVHLATNQAAARAAYMKEALGYDQLFDQSFYSCDLGVAKPEPAFFTRALDQLGATAPEVLFVDDHEANVAAAREVGLAAECWHLDEGVRRLCVLLEQHGLLVG